MDVGVGVIEAVLEPVLVAVCVIVAVFVGVRVLLDVGVRVGDDVGVELAAEKMTFAVKPSMVTLTSVVQYTVSVFEEEVQEPRVEPVTREASDGAEVLGPS